MLPFLARSAAPQVERHITNQTYILRLHVTTQMAQRLFPPRAELEAEHQAAVALEPPRQQGQGRPHGSVSSTYQQLFKQRLQVVDERGRSWPVQVRPLPCARACGWSRAAGLGV